MPIYEYSCSECGKTLDLIQKINDPVPETCQHCGAKGTLSKLVSRSSFVLKGGGWYSDLYGSSKNSSSTGSSKSSSSGPKSGETSGSGTEKSASSSETSSTKSSAGGEKS